MRYVKPIPFAQSRILATKPIAEDERIDSLAWTDPVRRRI